MLRRSYDWMMGFAGHPHATWVLAIISFAESSFFPIPPDPLYYAMLLKQRERSWYFASVCTITSVLGGWVGYMIGDMLYDSVGSWIIQTYHLESAFENFHNSFEKWGFWIIALKGLTPIPYKVVTIACGIAQYDFLNFTLASILARGFRFFLVASLFWHYGAPIKEYIDNNLGFVTTAALVALVGGFGLIYAFG